MSTCCPHSQSASGLFSFFAGRHAKRYARKGLENTQRQLVEGLRQAGIEGASLLEIGSGVGYLHQTLLREGASSAIGIDLAEKMLCEARAAATAAGLGDHTRYLQGDFVTFDQPVDTADITILDKVVCCYPDADALLAKSLDHTRRVLALTYPRDRWVTRGGRWLMAGLMWLIRSDFRSYVHDPEAIEAQISAAGFRKRYQNTTMGWLTQVYVRPS